MNSSLEVDANNWNQEVLKSSKLTVVYFWYVQCPWCAVLNPIFDNISREYGNEARFVKLNILSNPANREVASTYGVMSTPTLMFFCDGRPLGQAVGLVSEEQLRNILEDMLKMYKQCIRQSTELKSYIV